MILNSAGSGARISAILGAGTLLGLAAVTLSGPEWGWTISLMSAVAAAAAAFQACARLALGAPTAGTRRAWQAALAFFCLISLAKAASVAGEPLAGIWPVVRYALLACAPVLLLSLSRADPFPSTAHALLWLAFGLQAAGTAAPPAPAISAALADCLALQCCFLGLGLSVAALRRRKLVVERTVADCGDFARYLFATSRLFSEHRYPRLAGYAVPGGKLGLGIARFFAMFFRLGPRVRDLFGRSLWRQFLDLCAVALRHGLDPQAYYMFELYRDGQRARASGYLTRYETKNGIFTVLTRQIPKGDHRTQLDDKLATYLLCKEHGIPSVPTIAVARDGKIEFLDDGPQMLAQDLFIKPQKMKGARGTEIFRHAGEGFVDEAGRALTRDALMERIARISAGMTILLQPRIRNHPDLADLAGESLIPIRVITCLDETGQPVLTHGMLRILSKLEPDWPTDAELGAPVDLESGVLGLMTGDKPGLAFDWHENHPLTHARILGRSVPHWKEVRDTALAAHSACRDRLLIGWDIAIGPDGPLLLEGNAYADVDFLQRVHRCPIGASPLGPPLFCRLVDVERRLADGTLLGPYRLGRRRRQERE